MNVIGNFRYALRSLARSPGYAVAFVVTLGLGIGANTAIFSVVNGVLLRPLPYQDADRIMYVQQPAALAGVANTNFSFVEVADYRRAAGTVDELVEFGDWTFNVVGRGDPHRAVGGLVTSNYFDVLGMRPHLGRTLGPQDDGDGAEPVIVLTHAYWTRMFGEDPNVVGQRVELTGKPATVVGVLEPGSHYTGTRRQDFYANYATNDHYMGAAMQDERTHRMTDVFARLAPGSTVDGARAEMRQLASRLHEEYPEAYPTRLGFDLAVAPWQDELTKTARPTLLLLLGTVVLVLIIACANVANLTLTRLIRRERELAIRSALGAGKGRIRTQLLTENLVLSVGGAVLGLIVAVFGLDILVAYTNRFTIRTGEIGIDGSVLAFTLVIGVGVAMLLAWAPSLPMVKNLGGSLSAAGGGRTTGALSRRRMQRLLVVSQLAFSFALLIGAGLLVRSLVRLSQVDPGFDVENVLTLEAPNMTGKSPEENLQVYESVVERIRSFPGVSEVAVASAPPLRSPNPFAWLIRVDGEDFDVGAARPLSAFNRVTHEYFDVVGTTLLGGRSFSMMDNVDGERVAVVNQAMVRSWFPDGDVVGRRISWTFSESADWSEWTTIVGVVGDTKDYGLARDVVPTVFLPAAQSFTGPAILVKTSGDPTVLAREVTNVIHELDPDRPVDRIMTLEQLRSEDIAPQRLNATLFGVFALLALVIAAVGVLGVLAFSVSQRTHEFGVRLALGADGSTVLRMVLREGAAMAVAGLVIGGIAAVGLSRFLSGLLFEIEPTDPATFVGVGLVLAAVAVTAAFIPARRATRVDPMDALRSE